MANQGLAFNDSAGGNRGYNGLWIGNVSSPIGESGKPSLFREAFFAAAKDEVLPNIVTVTAGVPILSGSLLDEDGLSVPPGVVVTITKPDGTLFNTTSSVYTDDLMIHIDPDGNLSSFIVKNPMVGNWTIATNIPDGSEPNFQLFVSTMPTGTNDKADMEAALQSAFQPRFTTEQLDGFVTKYELVSWECFWCQVGSWIVAVVIVVTVTIVGAAIAVKSGAIVALAGFAGVSPEATLIFVRTIIALVVMGVNKVVTSICGWTGACSPALTLNAGMGQLSIQGG